ncbi:hypothetical protein [Streptomyces mirabilis]|uniref:hypothetical protein n=1 Tax=Streptomyces mirabilis TaxID=68239 RepID=UPI0036B1787E
MQAFQVKWSGGRGPAPGASFARPGGPRILPDSSYVSNAGAVVYIFLESLRPYELIEVSTPHYFTVTANTGPPVQPSTPLESIVYVGLSHAWPYEITWSELLAANVLDDGDVVHATIDPGAVPESVVEITLASDLWWWKEINVPDGLGSAWDIHTGAGTFGGRRFRDTVGLWADQVHNGQWLTFRKAKTVGLLSDTYLLRGLERLPAGSRVTFTWLKD